MQGVTVAQSCDGNSTYQIMCKLETVHNAISCYVSDGRSHRVLNVTDQSVPIVIMLCEKYLLSRTVAYFVPL